MLPGMRLFGYSAREFFRIGIAAVVFILAAKWLVPKTNVPALSQAIERV